jgi:hypothetical protein
MVETEDVKVVLLVLDAQPQLPTATGRSLLI